MGHMGKLLVTAAIAATLSGCYGIRYNASSLPDDAVSMTSVSTGVEGRHFVTKRRVTYLLWGMWALSRPELSTVIREEAGERRVVNLQIQSEMTPVDGLIWLGGGVATAFLLSLAGLGPLAPLVSTALVPQTQTLTIEGDMLQDAPGR